MNSSEYTEEFPRQFRGNTKFGFLGISSEYSDGIPRKTHLVGIFRRNTEETRLDEVSQLQTDDDDSTASTNLSRVRINEIVESSVPKKKGCMVGLGRRSRSAAPSSAPPPYVDPEVLTAQLKDKDDRISALETQMAAQQAGYETQKRLNEQMMEMMKRMYPNEELSSLGIFRGTFFPRNFPRNIIPSEILSEELSSLGIFRGTFFPRNFPRNIIPSEFSEECFVETSEDLTIGIPSVYSEEPSDEHMFLGVSSEFCFLGIPSEISDGIPRKEFYTVIPHDFGFQKMREFVINTPEKLRQKLDMVEALNEIEVAKKEDPLYSYYQHLRCDLTPICKDSEEFAMIAEYIENTRDKRRHEQRPVAQVFRTTLRTNLPDDFNKNRMLLWHGSHLTNWASILTKGPQIAPPEAPHRGYMFGKGVYFADMFSKSKGYSFYENSVCKDGVLLLCEYKGSGKKSTEPERSSNSGGWCCCSTWMSRGSDGL
ncbi:hypothetical protein IGI04_019022 [Brassica rapa subsp. trilocularis]|uniref:Poly [ADP-ribose] polymerase n=1 Tax=Brassica rapa subsp. trilocularis TaxID=1813537 RepID=A0ABQ7MEM9_BRACM|nr:hypothetical protein IGI04_019022 [Brassica rapa subsp. trilocularis]